MAKFFTKVGNFFKGVFGRKQEAVAEEPKQPVKKSTRTTKKSK